MSGMEVAGLQQAVKCGPAGHQFPRDRLVWCCQLPGPAAQEGVGTQIESTTLGEGCTGRRAAQRGQWVRGVLAPEVPQEA